MQRDTSSQQESAALEKKTIYSAISLHDQQAEEKDARGYQGGRSHPQLKRIIVVLLSFVGLVALGLCWATLSLSSRSMAVDDSTTVTAAQPGRLPMPYGVNLASWLSLEDYFFVGDDGAVEVATPNGSVAAQCLPPLHTHRGVSGPAWNSETDLFQNLTELFSVKQAIRVFHAFRSSYIDIEAELGQMAEHGIRNVRVPISWCLTDFDPSADDMLVEGSASGRGEPEQDRELLRRYTCTDPYFAKQGVTIHWPAVPKALLQRFLRACSKYGIRATLDIHTYCGGTSLGTFSGVWPRQPLFWVHDDPEHKDDDFGRSQFRNWLQWIEALSESDPEAFAGIGGITPMNEPAHLAGLFGPGSKGPLGEGFLPVLPRHLAEPFLTVVHICGCCSG